MKATPRIGVRSSGRGAEHSSAESGEARADRGRLHRSLSPVQGEADEVQERQRSHAVILATQGDRSAGIGRMLFLTGEAVRQWVERYERQGLAGLEHHPRWGGAHGQRCVSTAQREE